MVEPYRPSNGTEGDGFYEGWCAKCERDRDPENAPCTILTATLALRVDDPAFPSEWVLRDGWPTCTAFTPLLEDWMRTNRYLVVEIKHVSGVRDRIQSAFANAHDGDGLLFLFPTDHVMAQAIDVLGVGGGWSPMRSAPAGSA